jgi:hypothetical protein
MRNSKPERLGGLEIDDDIELCRLLDRDVGGLRPAQNLIDQLGGAPKQIRKACAAPTISRPRSLHSMVARMRFTSRVIRSSSTTSLQSALWRSKRDCLTCTFFGRKSSLEVCCHTEQAADVR